MSDHPQAAVEAVARWMQAIVAADRWKGRDLSAELPQKWAHLRPETQRFWADEATALLDQITPILTADLQARLDAAEADKRAAVLDEREACARLIEGFRQERNHIGDQKCAALFRKAYAAIRARGDA